MADDRLERAVDAVARRIIATLGDPENIADLWGNYPEIGEQDWAAVVDRASSIMTRNRPPDTFYDAAYEYLARRAGVPGDQSG